MFMLIPVFWCHTDDVWCYLTSSFYKLWSQGEIMKPRVDPQCGLLYKWEEQYGPFLRTRATSSNWKHGGVGILLVYNMRRLMSAQITSIYQLSFESRKGLVAWPSLLCFFCSQQKKVLCSYWLMCFLFFFLFHCSLPFSWCESFPTSLQLTDFGLARFYSSNTCPSKKDSEEKGGTFSYMPPEAFDLKYTPRQASDIYRWHSAELIPWSYKYCKTYLF